MTDAPKKLSDWNDGPLRDAARDGVLQVLRSHGYDLPGIADLCAGAALRNGGRLLAGPTPEDAAVAAANAVRAVAAALRLAVSRAADVEVVCAFGTQPLKLIDRPETQIITVTCSQKV